MASGDSITGLNLKPLIDKMGTILNSQGPLQTLVYPGIIYSGSYAQTIFPMAGYFADDLTSKVKLVSGSYDRIYDAADRIATYYNITNPFTNVSSGDIIRWSDYDEHADAFLISIQTRFLQPWLYSSGWDVSVQNEVSESVSNWNGTKTLIVKVTWPTMDRSSHRRESGDHPNLGSIGADDIIPERVMETWFTAGGEIRISFSHNDTSENTQGTSWETLTSNFGTHTISTRLSDSMGSGQYEPGDYTKSFGSTAIQSRTRQKYHDVKYFAGTFYATNHTTGWIPTSQRFGTGDYSSNSILIENLIPADNNDNEYSTTIRDSYYIRITLDDAHVAKTGSGSGYGGAWSWTGADTVPGTTTISIDSLKMANSTGSVIISNPTFTVIDSL